MALTLPQPPIHRHLRWRLCLLLFGGGWDYPHPGYEPPTPQKKPTPWHCVRAETGRLLLAFWLCVLSAPQWLPLNPSRHSTERRSLSCLFFSPFIHRSLVLSFHSPILHFLDSFTQDLTSLQSPQVLSLTAVFALFTSYRVQQRARLVSPNS